MITDEAVNQILLRVDKLADRIGITVDQIWPWLIRKQYMDFYLSLGCFLSLLTIWIILLIIIKKYWKPEDSNVYSIHRNDHEVLFIVPAVLIAILLFGALFGLIFDMSNVLNPEYSALKDLMSMVSDFK